MNILCEQAIQNIQDASAMADRGCYATAHLHRRAARIALELWGKEIDKTERKESERTNKT